MSKKQATQKLAKQNSCLAPGCGNAMDSRGLCVTCYRAMRRKVKAGERTWEELEKLGLALPPHKTGRPKTAAIHKALKKKTAKRSVK